MFNTQALYLLPNHNVDIRQLELEFVPDDK